ncbi:transferase family-domain-containing protein [Aspergillus tamarii]|uniref:Transferase family-domain-containing protein n=1 Tax=Aspergillus tamarii TaxID=41984 RepID=A0A5N6UZQ9_ASPTM|nr:transferase family-domain-containing protein [Aspergillus tamarii]
MMSSTDEIHVTARHSVQCASKTAILPLESPFNLGPGDHLVFPFVPIQVIFIYRNSPIKGGIDSKTTEIISAERLRRALSIVLDYYPHLTGRLHFNPSSKVPEIAALGTGAELLEAQCSSRLDDIASASTSGRILMPNLPASGNTLLPPFDPTMEGVCRDPLVAIKHTRFACGGVSLGIRLHHIVCDAHGFFQFVRDLAELYRGVPINQSEAIALPTLSSPPEIRSYLSAADVMSSEKRHEALKYQPSVFYIEGTGNASTKPQDPPSTNTNQKPQPRVIGRVLRFPGPELQKLKTLATDPSPQTQSWVSTSDALSAYLYQRSYQARFQHLKSQGMSSSKAASELSRGFWASINFRSRDRLNLHPRYFPNAVYCPTAYHSHELLADKPLWQVAKALHEQVHSVDSSIMERTMKWVAAQPDKSRIKVNFEFGNGSFIVSQWTKFDMYVGVNFDVDVDGKPITPALVSPPFTEISLVDGLAMMLSTEEQTLQDRGKSDVQEDRVPCAIDVNLTLSEPLWEILDRDDEFRKFCCC